MLDAAAPNRLLTMAFGWVPNSEYADIFVAMEKQHFADARRIACKCSDRLHVVSWCVNDRTKGVEALQLNTRRIGRSTMPPKSEDQPNYQSQDIWSLTTTANGYSVDELRSVLQKSIRRGWVEEAALAAYELFSSSPETEEVLWRRLEIIATEDVGLGLVTAPAIIEALNQQRMRMDDRGDRWIYCAHAVRLLATARKDNMSMELAGRLDAGGRCPGRKESGSTGFYD